MATSYLGLDPIDRTSLVEIIALALDADRPLCIWGSPGIAKSDTVNEVAPEKGYAVVDYRVGNVPPEDLGGLMWPNQESRRVDRYMPDIVAQCWHAHEATGKPVALFIDEINHANMSVQGPLYAVVRDRQSGGFALPPGTRIIAAGNPDGTGSISETMSRALMDRFWVVEYGGPTPSEFAAYGHKVGLHPAIAGYLVDHPADLNAFDPDVEVSPTPRAWADLSQVLNKTASTSLMLQAANGHVGPEVGLRFAAYVEMFGQLPSFQDIVQDPEAAKLPDDFSGQYMVTTMLSNKLVEFWSYEKGRMVNTKDKAELEMRRKVHAGAVTYLFRLPNELQVTGLTALLMAKPGEGVASHGAPLLTQMLSDFRQSSEGNTERYLAVVQMFRDLSEDIASVGEA